MLSSLELFLGKIFPFLPFRPVQAELPPHSERALCSGSMFDVGLQRHQIL